MPNNESVEYVWTRAIGAKTEVSPRFATPEEAGEWLRSSEGREVAKGMLFGPTLRALDDGNWTRSAHPNEWRRARASQPAAS